MNKKYLTDLREKESIYYLKEAMEVAKKSTCLRSKCGVLIVKDSILGIGFNSPPGNLESQRRCHIKKNEYDEKVTDKTCCVHAEQRAIFDALSSHRFSLEGSILYFARLNLEDEFIFAKEPYCTICSKSILDVGIESVVLWHEEGIAEYGAEEYNNLSFKYSSKFL